MRGPWRHFAGILAKYNEGKGTIDQALAAAEGRFKGHGLVRSVHIRSRPNLSISWPIVKLRPPGQQGSDNLF